MPSTNSRWPSDQPIICISALCHAQRTANATLPYDARLRVIRQIVARRGQEAFRAVVLHAYGGQCAITGCDAGPALEAAHLRPYRGPDSNVISNGLPLRGDIHTLFDLGLLAVDPATLHIVVSKLLAGTQYGSLAGRVLAGPAEDWQRPDSKILWKAGQLAKAVHALQARGIAG